MCKGWRMAEGCSHPVLTKGGEALEAPQFCLFWDCLCRIPQPLHTARSVGSAPRTSHATPSILQEPGTAQPELSLAKPGSGRAEALSCSKVVSPAPVTCGSRGGESFTLSIFRSSPVRLLRRNQVV